VTRIGQRSPVHQWHQTVLGFSPKLVTRCLAAMDISRDATVLDPFCGLGTALVECKRRGIDSVGVDANPAAVFVTRAKVAWRVRPERLINGLHLVEQRLPRRACEVMCPENAGRPSTLGGAAVAADPVYRYMRESGMLDRGWLADRVARKLVLIQQSLAATPVTSSVRRLLALALLATAVRDASNVSFGPELYCRPGPGDSDVLGAYRARVETIATDLAVIDGWRPWARHRVVEGDSRRVATVLRGSRTQTPDAVITSPPYPAEHDYTRNMRLELVLLGLVASRGSLRQLKRSQLRCHTKGIYKSDDDARHVKGNRKVAALCAELEARAQGRSDGFSRLYARVVAEYFGGMMRHLLSLAEAISPGVRLAYVVADQRSYLGVAIPTADLLAELAFETGRYRVEGVEEWRRIRSKNRGAGLGERILHLSRRDVG